VRVFVMAGDILPDAPGVVRPSKGGWHDTGDIVTLDERRVVTVKGRVKRFARSAAKMVSLAAVDALAAGLWPDTQHVVVWLPDERKGEQLVLVTDEGDADRAALLAHAKAEGFPELWVPRTVLVVTAIPVSGTSKVGLQATRTLVASMRPLL
jgi:acyl-[acyl-carrier-protein]-phospholipid O-acyltransferase / long-chain-fatty-acid--[acyl-carrier-protein] ligase